MQYQGVCRHAARVGLALCAMGLSTRPAAAEDLSAAVTPFVLQADDPARARAVHCLTQAIYYEAGTEPLSGQQAVAQVVLNRLKHPAFPKSVCGVVFEGAGRSSGCQFSFTCDASLSRQPVAWRWNAAQRVAEAALSGFVDTEVGTSTHYHAAWMTPYWSASLIRTGRIGGHI
ncbi:MAG: cell wall hydrolase, partial [Caulobacteraceae bacterium]|nr:cell wall hydrolase [Caulobacteraceae bacterium]